MEWRTTTLYIVHYMADGSVEEYNLADPHIPLPSFRALVKQTQPNPLLADKFVNPPSNLNPQYV